jgi:membrane-bound metal-dependent hydrolase YbcI (DUF457 family)
MRLIWLLKPGLFIYECIRLMFLITAIAVIQPEGLKAYPWLAYTASNALFPLITLFLWLNISRYRDYLPLLLAGKCVGLFALICWAIITRQMSMIWEFSSNPLMWLAPRMVAGILMCGDFFAVTAVLLIYKNTFKNHGESLCG